MTTPGHLPAHPVAGPQTPARPTLDQLLPAVASQLGVPRFSDPLGLAHSPLSGVASMVVLLVDGLGWQQLVAHDSLAPRTLSGFDLGPMHSTFPSTTAAAVTSFGTGLGPGMHGIIGSAFEVDGTALWPLSWAADPNPIATQPERTVLEAAAAAGVAVASVAPARFAGSGLTRAGLRGGRYLGADTVEARVVAVAGELAAARRSRQRCLVYVYWPELDKAGHVHGVNSPQWRAELAVVDELVGELASLLQQGEGLLVTADHGILDVPDSARIDLDGLSAQLSPGVRRVLGEPRVRHVYTEPGRARAVLAAWQRTLAGRATVVGRDEAAATWFAPVDPWYTDRIGDVVALAGHGLSLVSDRVDRIVSNLRGQHGGRDPREVEIPLLAFGG